MRKLLAVAALLLASTAAQAQYTFEYGGKTIRIDPDRGTVHIPGVYDNTKKSKKRGDVRPRRSRTAPRRPGAAVAAPRRRPRAASGRGGSPAPALRPPSRCRCRPHLRRPAIKRRPPLRRQRPPCLRPPRRLHRCSKALRRLRREHSRASHRPRRRAAPAVAAVPPPRSRHRRPRGLPWPPTHRSACG